jgi:integrase
MAKHIRGTGTVYPLKGTRNLWCQFFVNGRRFNESTGTDNPRLAASYLRQRLADADSGSLVPNASSVTVATIVEAKLTSDRVNGSDSYDTTKGRWELHLKPILGHLKAAVVTTDILMRYAEGRQAEGAGNASINRELALLKTSYKLAMKSGTLKFMPWFQMLQEPPARSGFLKDDEYQKLAAACAKEGTYLAAMFEVAHSFGWRSESVRTMKVRQADFFSNTIRLDDSKNGTPVVAPLTKKLHELLAMCATGKPQDAPLFTYPDGTAVKDFRKAWWRATEAAGVPDLIFHDLCRTAMRNMRRLHISTNVAKRVAGRKTDSIFNRYNIVDDADLAEVATRIDQKCYSSTKAEPEKQEEMAMVAGQDF